MGADTKVTWQQCVLAGILAALVVLGLYFAWSWATAPALPAGTVCLVPK